MKLAILLVNYNTSSITLECLKSIFRYPPKESFEVWVADNASTDDSIDQIEKQFPRVNLVKSSANLGFAKGNDLVLKKVFKKFEYCLLLNTDTIVYKGSFDKLLDFAENGGFGISSCKLISPDRSFQPNAGSLPGFFPVFFWLSGLDDLVKKFLPIPSYHQESPKFYLKDRQVGWISGSVMLLSNKLIAKIGLLDEKIFMYGEDVDYCMRAHKAGFKVGWTLSATIMHIGGASSKAPRFKQWSGEFKGLFYLYRKYYGSLAAFGIRLLSYLFICLRALAFLVIGRVEHAKTYAKVITNI
ncbi:hypothetical protein A2V61_02790 [Candidatus Woesebacteria bacterium RBG_19FT_COMBO_47_8]|uniref:Glycosyltransferase 2-like domain-containing protein n=1 Tax=Candidatus Woesebacteria bacterium RBG_13_46_13 TaxID=1802479 RepID=A0A1F7X2N2_9BACT|nr:MAG: hypothetical protein A2Y68_00070 [Candidatus Woesebacteria bacterium RBG_13_46_13]OGM17877.1 MAG: hypothetical protein A2V61_02790 [Candidatus Woesebacteria bacterium RBG_19FT_COMBO_47_8]HJX58963.1 glycosyltransferase family 2 protein [Patescibacteria group bacterium]